MQKYEKKKNSLNNHLEHVRQLNQELLEMHKELREAQGDRLPPVYKRSKTMPLPKEKGGTRQAQAKTAPPLSRNDPKADSSPRRPAPGEPWPDPPQRHKPAKRVAAAYMNRADELHNNRLAMPFCTFAVSCAVLTPTKQEQQPRPRTSVQRCGPQRDAESVHDADEDGGSESTQLLGEAKWERVGRWEAGNDSLRAGRTA
eukprot:616676-Rhodomonas_salina.1